MVQELRLIFKYVEKYSFKGQGHTILHWGGQAPTMTFHRFYNLLVLTLLSQMGYVLREGKNYYLNMV